MKITLVGPGIMSIPPTGWGAVEILIWDTKNSLEKMGHIVQIINTVDYNQIISEINHFEPDFVHIHYDDFIGLYSQIDYPKAITSHFGYLERPEMFGGYANIANSFANIKPNVFCLSDGIKKVYKVLMNIPEDNLFLTPNGVNLDVFNYTDNPTYSDRSIYLAKIDYRKRQHTFQQIESLWFAGNVADSRFDISKNYLGEWSKEVLYQELTNYGNLVLLSDGEAHPLVCMEALASGLGVVVSEWGQANLDTTKEFITIIPESKITDLEYVEQKIIENREYSIKNREKIIEYSKSFDWIKILENYYIPNVNKVIETYNSQKKSPMVLDKNKSVYKLKNFGPIYYLNLDGQPERSRYMETQFKHWEIENYTRISAHDGRSDDLSDILIGRYPEMMTSGEIGCVTSHLKAIKYWYETSDTPYAIIMEDDCNIDIARYWNFTWEDFIARVPYCWDVIQLAIICTGDIHIPVHTRFVNDFSTACYVITRHHAEKLLKYHVRGNKYKLDNGVKPRPVADDLIYNSGVTYSTPLLLYNIGLGSSIHQEHVDVFHRQSHDGIFNFWQQTGAQMTLDQIVDYNPYLGRVSEPSKQQS